MNMVNEDPWFFEERAFAFAKLVLTKQHDVRPYVGRDIAIDLLVDVCTKSDSTQRRLFGVQIVAYMDLPDRQNADERVLSHLGRDSFEAMLPICVFVIGVRKPEGIYRWVVEPVLENGQALLHRNAKVSWQPLDEVGVARLIERVNAWYDARKEESAAKLSARHSKTES
jgi:hypothetical protein